jgi:UDP-N-acetylglucosamine acyltransferase
MESLKASFEEAFFHNNITYIHSTALVGPNVTLDENVKVGPFAIITGRVHIGAGTRIYPHATIGFPAESIGTRIPHGTISIGKNCEIREFVTIHASKYPDGTTKVGDNAYLMNYSHISHDVILENDVVLINNVQLGGHTYVEHHAFLMANSATHQFSRIGQYTALAPFSGIRQDLPPFCIFNGQPAGFAGLNAVGLRRAGFSSNNIQALKKITTLFYQQKLNLEAIQELIAADITLAQDVCVQLFLTFVINSQRGVSRKTTINSTVSFEAGT